MDDDQLYMNIDHTLNYDEKRLIKNVHHNYSIKNEQFYELFRAIAKSRVVFGPSNDKFATKDDLPFCDVIQDVEKFEKDNKLEYSINSQWTD